MIGKCVINGVSHTYVIERNPPSEYVNPADADRFGPVCLCYMWEDGLDEYTYFHAFKDYDNLDLSDIESFISTMRWMLDCSPTYKFETIKM